MHFSLNQTFARWEGLASQISKKINIRGEFLEEEVFELTLSDRKGKINNSDSENDDDVSNKVYGHAVYAKGLTWEKLREYALQSFSKAKLKETHAEITEYHIIDSVLPIKLKPGISVSKKKFKGAVELQDAENENKLAKVNKHFKGSKMVKELMNAYYLLKDDEDQIVGVSRPYQKDNIGFLCNFKSEGLKYVETNRK